ncbi:MAG: glycosyltransferase family 2 protein [Actinomycetota bacterium]|nr:glycosyltransferase family 2 protein [Actinomycetota bacterium]
MSVSPARPVAVVVPAKDEARRIASTVRAAQALAGVRLVVVVDDGSTDATGDLARSTGARVVRHASNQGKAAAMTTGAAVAAAELGEDHLLLFVDADLEESAGALGVLVPPVASGEADMSVAILPPQASSGGGHGFVVRLARRGIADLTGWTPTQPLSGMRCLSRDAYLTAQPLARGWGVEVGLTVDVLAAGMTVVEVPCDLHHRVTGSDWAAQLHRARQYRDVALALARRRLRRARRTRSPRQGGG